MAQMEQLDKEFEAQEAELKWTREKVIAAVKNHQSFEGIDLISHSYKRVREYKFVRLGKFANQVLALLGSQYVDRYSSKMLI